MRRMTLAGMFVMMAGMVHAQTFEEWFKQKETQIKYLVEQIIALKAYGEVMVKGYDIANKGLTNISGIKAGDYQQHSNYFLSLWKVKSDIKNYAKVASVYKMVAAIEQQRRVVK